MMERIKWWIKEYWLLLLLCVVMLINLGYMHHEVYLINYSGIEHPRLVILWLLDVLLPLIVFMVAGKRKVALVLTYVFLMFFAVANIGYSRFFNQYITINVFAEVSNLKGLWWISYLKDAFRWTDIILVVTTALFSFGITKISRGEIRKDMATVATLIVASLLIYISPDKMNWFKADSFKQSRQRFSDLVELDKIARQFNWNQEAAIFYNGLLRGQLYGNIAVSARNITLSSDEIEKIDRYLSGRRMELMPLSDSCVVRNTPNVVFILVESYISAASKVAVGGKEITPHLNNLMRDRNTYTNMRMMSQRGAGESSDAQVSYLTGMLPLSSDLSISYIVRDSIVGFPKLLKEQKGYNTYITLPTPAYVWHQNEVNPKYGFDNVIECTDKTTGRWGDDEGIFEKLSKCPLKHPYFNMVLTVSMHGPYNFDFLGSINQKSPFSYPDTFSEEYRHYLDKCYYTDVQIGKYLAHLKESGNYENTIIIVTSDHQIRKNSFKAVNNSDLPLIIANSGIPSSVFQDGKINQIDVYPTMIDMFGIKTDWHGMGHSLLREGYSSEISPLTREVSDKMLRGDYFRVERN